MSELKKESIGNWFSFLDEEDERQHGILVGFDNKKRIIELNVPYQGRLINTYYSRLTCNIKGLWSSENTRPIEDELRQKIEELENKVDDCEDKVHKVATWINAYPVKIFPEVEKELKNWQRL